MLLRHAVVLEHFLARPGGAIGVDADLGTVAAGVLLPAKGDAGLNRDARCAGGAKDGGLPLVALGVEDFPARERDDPGGDTVGGKLVASHDGQLDLGAGADQDDIGHAVGVGEDVATLGRVTSGTGLVEDRQVLPGEDQCGRGVALNGVSPGRGGFVAIGRADGGELRDQPQRHHVLDRFVGWSVFTNRNRIVGEDPDRLEVAEGGEPDGRAHVVGEDEEGGAERNDATVGGEAVDDGPHAVLADAEVDVAAGIVPVAAGEALFVRGERGRVPEIAATLEHGVGGWVEVGRTADEAWQILVEGVHDLAGGLAGRHRLGIRRPGRDAGIPTRRQLAGDGAFEGGGFGGEGGLVGRKSLVPLSFGRRPLVD